MEREKDEETVKNAFFSKEVYMQNTRDRRSLLPSKRPKKRYVAFKIITNKEITIGDIKKSILSAFKQNISEKNMEKSNVLFIDKRYNFRKKSGLVKVTPEFQSQIVNTLRNIMLIKDIKVRIKTLGVSGTIKKAYKRYIAS